ncbi:Sodium/calcium exchanger protein-domain-containing protein [Daldinia decipiens]|uniref:Sodium/calcium exchanger protein-domain-containing protein n=1 Tax=Daldinia decipiens TaxID=326647 RepID=UPI0020C3497C|nr:Sodium/calcium exchanger protein-domain-containing protein [Daldinia decipiens]KAI1660252.1 Sodium/calcium exchanger protein-domain-containing protein [Daldinia decipiens]
MYTAVRGRKGFTSRPFYTTLFIITLIATYSLFVRGPAVSSDQQPTLSPRSSEDCRLVHYAEDKCAFVRRNCHGDEAGLIEYLTFYYCDLERAQPLAFIVLALWLGLLFTTIGIAASDFFSVNLSTIATILGLSESLAGVTFLAFGNGSPDVFSTFAAMSSNSGSMAVGELIGAAGFITSVVAGSMALVREFKVSRKTFVRDICFFIAAVGFAMGFLADGNLHLWECSTMIAFYIFYVIVVVGWHAVSKRRRARRLKEALARSHYYAPASERSNDELEPYRDDPDDEDARPIERRSSERSGSSITDVDMLERGPRIEVGAPDDDDDTDRSHVAAEMASSMRVNRPRGRRSNTTTITPIRPSLVGVLEFRSVLSSLQEEGNVRMRPLYHTRSSSADLLGTGHAVVQGAKSTQTIQNIDDAFVAARNRAHSSGALPIALDADLAPRKSFEDRGRTPSPRTIGGKLAPPPNDQFGGLHTDNSGPEDMSPNLPPQLHHLRIPSPHGSERSSPSLSPFPVFAESPLVFSEPSQQPPHLILPPAAQERSPSFLNFVEHANLKPIRWWPYRILPSPHVIVGTLFPTLQDWRGKNIWDKFVSIISVPSIFLLVITLPVVETEATDDDSEENIVEQPASGYLESTAISVSTEPGGSIEPETEWQRYRRRARSRASSRSHSPSLISVTAPDNTQGPDQIQVAPSPPPPNVQITKPAPELLQDSSTLGDDEQGWNRWLLILQVFTGPLFGVFVVWANMIEDLDQPVATLVKALLVSLACSLVLLGIILMTTSPDRRPKYHFLFCFLGFCISIAWISTIAGEVVGVMKAFGVILDISEAILGLTIFAVGNSVGDLVADVTVARLGYPVMALSACFGGPLLNILLGIGLGGAYQTIHAANKKKAKHPDRPIHYKPYHIQVNGTLMISAITLLITLFALLIIVPINRWIMSRKIGWGLIGLWSISTVVNLVIEVTGVWQDIA